MDIPLTDFKKSIDIQGVNHYTLLKTDGSLILQDDNAPETLGGLVLACGQTCETERVKGIRQLIFFRENHEHLHVFCLPGFYLGILQEKTANPVSLANQISSALVRIMQVEKPYF